jgi:DNA end-binding protein Ku
VKVDAKAVPLVRKLIGDLVQERLKDIIAAKRKVSGKPRRRTDEEKDEPASNVVDIMEALRRSIGTERRGSRR